MSTPPRRYDLQADDVALVVVDVQNDFVSGSLAIPGAEAIVDPINAMAVAAKHVIVVTDWHPVGHVSFASAHPGHQEWDVVETSYGPQQLCADHCVQGSWGAELDPRLELTKAELIFRKGYRTGVDSYGAFYENDGATVTGLTGYLTARGIGKLVVTGLARYGCVAQTAVGAARDGFDVSIVDEAAVGGDGELAERSKREMLETGVGVVSVHDLLVLQS